MFPLLLVACQEAAVTKHNAPPGASISAPAEGAAVREGDPIDLRGAASDADDVSSSLVAAWYAGTEELCPPAAPADDGTTTCTTTASPDRATLTLEVRDPAGETASDTVTLDVTANAAPSVTLTAPADGATWYSDQLLALEGRVLDDVAGELAITWTSSLDGVLLEGVVADADGSVRSAAYLSEGEHQLTLAAVDEAGARGSASVLLDIGGPNTAPTCTITAPVDGSRGEAGADLLLRGVVGDGEEPAQDLAVTWTSSILGDLGTSTPASSGDVALSVSGLTSGTHVLTMSVADEVGATCTTFVVYVVGSAPTVVITSPAGGTVDDGDLVTLEAAVTDGDDDPTTLVAEWTSDLDGVVDVAAPDGTGLVSGAVGLSVGTHHLTLVVTDPGGLQAEDTATVVVNGAPTAPGVVIEPTSPLTGDTLVASVTTPATDPEGDTISYTWAWYRDGALTGETGSSVAASATAQGERWEVVATPHDGRIDGPGGSAAVTIGNTAPEASAVSLSPAVVASDGTLACAATGADDDGDVVAFSYAWTVSGATVAATGDTLTSSWFAAGDTVTCTATPSDGRTTGTSLTSTASRVNHPPAVTTVSISPDPATGDDSLTCTATPADADGDPLSTSFAWTVDGVAAGSGATLDAASIRAGDVVVCVVTASDSLETGTGSDTLTIENTAPVVASVSLTPAVVASDGTLTCAATGADADGDAVSFSYAWTVSGSTVPATGATLGSSWFSAGDSVTCTVTPTDGTVTGTSLTSTASRVNHPPAVTTVTISPDPATGDDSLTCTATPADADGDPLSTSFAWTVDGVAAGSGATLGAASIRAGDVVVCVVTASDSLETGTGSDTLTIENTAPVVTSVTISPATLTTDTLATASVAASDADGDPLTYSYTWYVDGAVAGSGATLSGAAFDRGDSVHVEATANDGSVSSASVVSATIVVSNSPPGTPGVVVTPSTSTEQTSDLVCAVTTASADADGDTVTYLFSWSRNGTPWTGDTDTTALTGDTIDAADAEAGTWACVVEPDDGFDAGATATASALVTADTTVYEQIWTTGEYSCLLEDDASLTCWGSDSFDRTSPPAGPWVDASLGRYGGCGIHDDGTLECWGLDRYGFSAVPSGTYTDVSMTEMAACALSTAGTIECWGNDTGDSWDFNQTHPPTASNFVAVGLGYYHGCGVHSDNTTECWGRSAYSMQTEPSGTFTYLWGGIENECALGADGNPRCWGSSTYFTDASLPSSGVIDLSMTYGHVCWIDSERSVGCAGNDDTDQVSDTPDLSGVLDVAAGIWNTVALLDDGSIVGWGYNATGASDPPP